MRCKAMDRDAVPVVEPVCWEHFIRLTQDRQQGLESGQYSPWEPPTGPAIGISFDQVDTGWMPNYPNQGAVPSYSLVVIGHFDDRRATLCPQEVAAKCRDRFVVDRVESIDGVKQGSSFVYGQGDHIWAIEEPRARPWTVCEETQSYGSSTAPTPSCST
jgi:hypothetical protein